MPHFNLVQDPWIPVRWRDNRSGRPLVNLREAFTEGSSIADLSCAPHERVSLIRLLVCVTQAAIGAPASANHWKNWGSDLACAVPSYLDHWQDRFNLFGEGPRFLQVKIKNTQQSPRNEFLEFRMKSNETLFDHHAGTERAYPLSRIALNLLVLQNFFLPGSTGSPKIGGVKGAGPSINYLHSLILGRSLHETIVLNCLDEETIGFFWSDGALSTCRPVWEMDCNVKFLSSSSLKVGNSYLGRLVPIPCAIWLREDENRIWLSQGIEYPEFSSNGGMREPSATILSFPSKKNGKDELKLLKSDPERAIWRDLHCVAFVQRAMRSANTQCGPLIIQSHVMDERVGNGEVALWCGELIRAEGANGPTAKLEDLVEEIFPAPAELFCPDGQIRYQQGVEHAVSRERVLRGMVKGYQDNLRPRPSKPNKDESKDYPMLPDAQRHFWNSLDRQSATLLELLVSMFSENNPMGHWSFGERHDDGTFDPWTQAVRSALLAAYDHACPRQTPRQIQAYSAGLRVLLKPEAAASKKKSLPTPSTP